MKKNLKILITVLSFAVMICLVIFPDKYINVAFNGIKLWATSVLPSLFPFFFLTLLLTKMQTLNSFGLLADPFTKKHFRCNGISAYIFLMSILSVLFSFLRI